jgi:tetratricopeptide (TPR) repeat protein
VKPDTKLEGVEADKLRAFSQSKDIDLQALALMALHVSGEIEFSAMKAGLALRNRWAILADQLAGILSARGDLTNATICLEKSLEVMPDNIVTLSHLAFARANQGDLQSTVTLLKTAIAIRPHTANLHFQLAQIQLGLQQPAAAIQSLEDGLSYASDNQAARALLRQLRSANLSP